jgi:hypothetical protein
MNVDKLDAIALLNEIYNSRPNNPVDWGDKAHSDNERLLKKLGRVPTLDEVVKLGVDAVKTAPCREVLKSLLGAWDSKRKVWKEKIRLVDSGSTVGETTDIQPEESPEKAGESVSTATATKKTRTKKTTKARKASANGHRKPRQGLSALWAIVKVLSESDKPLKSKELVEVMKEKGYWTSPGAAPHNQVSARIYVNMAKEKPLFKKLADGFALTAHGKKAATSKDEAPAPVEETTAPVEAEVATASV